MKKEDQLITEQGASDNSLLLILPGHYTRKMASYPSSELEGNHANPTHTYFPLSEWSTYWNQQKTLKNSIQIHTKQNWKGIGTYIYTNCYSIFTYLELRCNLDVLMEKISTMFNYILSLPMLL